MNEFYQLGALDANEGRICFPEMNAETEEQILSYCRGYLSVHPTDKTANAFVSGSNDSLPKEK